MKNYFEVSPLELTTIHIANLPLDAHVRDLIHIVKPFGHGYNLRVIPPRNKHARFTIGFVEMRRENAKELLEYVQEFDIELRGRVLSISESRNLPSERSMKADASKERRYWRLKERDEKAAHRFAMIHNCD